METYKLNDIKRDEIISLAKKLLDVRSVEPEQPYWLCEDHGETFCLDCIKTMNPSGEYGEYYDGGFCCEEDGCEHCAKCGRSVEYTLTDYGVDTELAHFLEDGFDWDNPVDCYELQQVCYGVFTDEQKNKLITVFRKGINAPQEFVGL